jgi:hypothetical protein
VNPHFPLYIPTKGRYEVRLTSNALTEMRLAHTLVVEEPEFELYAAATKENPYASLLVLDERYKREYEVCDNLGLTKSTGPGPARNFIWEHSIAAGHAWHWVMDDNIRGFYRFNRNQQIKVWSGAYFRAMEDFCLRYSNVHMAGPNYYMFVPRKKKKPPLTLNTRIYSCNLIRNDIPLRWRGRYNEDTDLSLRILKAGNCTIQFNAFLQQKVVTQSVKGGNTAEFYAAEGTMPKSQMLVDLHPDVAKVVWRFGRWHHYVDYSPYEKNRLRRRATAEVVEGVNEYGMTLRQIAKSERIGKSRSPVG